MRNSPVAITRIPAAKNGCRGKLTGAQAAIIRIASL
jgi:hypothetical protein